MERSELTASIVVDNTGKEKIKEKKYTGIHRFHLRAAFPGSSRARKEQPGAMQKQNRVQKQKEAFQQAGVFRRKKVIQRAGVLRWKEVIQRGEVLRWKKVIQRNGTDTPLMYPDRFWR